MFVQVNAEDPLLETREAVAKLDEELARFAL